MDTKRIIKKYTILLLVYVILHYLIEPYGFRFYYSVIAEPQMIKETFNTLQSVLVTITYLINLVFMMIMMIMMIDSKNKKMIDWMILFITLIKAEIGIILFIVWNIYKENTLHNTSNH